MFGKNLIKEFELEGTFSIEEFEEELKKIEESENKDVINALIEKSQILFRNTVNPDNIKNLKTKHITNIPFDVLNTKADEASLRIAKKLGLNKVGKEIIKMKLLYQTGFENIINYLLENNINSKIVEQINSVINCIKRNPYQVSKQFEVLRKNIIHISNKIGQYNGCCKPQLVLNFLNYLVASNKELYQSLENEKRI